MQPIRQHTQAHFKGIFNMYVWYCKSISLLVYCFLFSFFTIKKPWRSCSATCLSLS